MDNTNKIKSSSESGDSQNNSTFSLLKGDGINQNIDLSFLRKSIMEGITNISKIALASDDIEIHKMAATNIQKLVNISALSKLSNAAIDLKGAEKIIEEVVEKNPEFYNDELPF